MRAVSEKGMEKKSEKSGVFHRGVKSRTEEAAQSLDRVFFPHFFLPSGCLQEIRVWLNASHSPPPPRATFFVHPAEKFEDNPESLALFSVFVAALYEFFVPLFPLKVDNAF